MTVSVFGKRYANALLHLAADAQAVDQIGRDLRDFVQAWGSNKELRVVFENPQVSQVARRRGVGESAGHALASCGPPTPAFRG